MVDHGLGGVVVQRLVLLVGDVREDVVVVGRQRDHGEDVAAAHVDDDGAGVLGAAHALLHELGDLPLEVEVDREHEAGAGLGGDLVDGLDFAAGGVDFDVLVSGLAAQHRFVDGFDAHLADAVVHLVALVP